jgi:AraC-like DNA-binding protein
MKGAGGSAHGAGLRHPDPLSGALAGLRPRCLLSGGSTLTAHWSLRSASDLPLGFYIVTRGRCWLQDVTNTATVQLAQGDLALVAQGLEHRLCDDPRSSCHRSERVLWRADVDRHKCCSFGGGGAMTRLLRANLDFRGGNGALLMSSLPPIVRLRRGGKPAAPWLAPAFGSLAAEIGRGGSAVQRMADLLAEVVIAQAIRLCMASASHEENGRLGALTDPFTGPILRIMHSRFGEPWSVAALAREAGLSRSLFAQRFMAAVGMSPMRYLLECRMQAASTRLRDGRSGVKEIAHETGYSSGPAFSSAFKRWSGRPPGAYREGAAVPEG